MHLFWVLSPIQTLKFWEGFVAIMHFSSVDNSKYFGFRNTKDFEEANRSENENENE